MNQLSKWDVYWATVKYDDSDEVKIRPVVILKDNQALFVALKSTSHSARDNNDYELKDWSKAGLSLPTTVRVKQQLNLNRSSLHKRIGKLSNRDIEQISKLLET